MKKLVYRDGDKERCLKGEITEEDTFFITLENEKNTFRINKQQVILIREEKEGDIEYGKNRINTIVR